MGALNDFQSGFQKSYNDAQSGKYGLVFVVILIAAALYFFQKWTGIPVLDWVAGALEWIFNSLWNLLIKLLAKA